MADYGTTAALAEVEALLREDVPGVTFGFGREDELRPESPPWICWSIPQALVQEGTPQANAGERQTERELPETAAFASDMVEVRARVVGAARRSTARDPSTRRAEFTASEQLMIALRWALCRWANNSPVVQELRWEPVQAEGPQDFGCPIDFFFRMRLDVLATPPLIADPDTLEGDLVVETT